MYSSNLLDFNLHFLGDWSTHVFVSFLVLRNFDEGSIQIFKKIFLNWVHILVLEL